MKALFAVIATAATFAVAAPAAAQEVDSRGIPVESQQATAPDGANRVTNPAPGTIITYAPDQQAVFATRPATVEYRPCERGQTDRCIQTYEGRRPARRRR